MNRRNPKSTADSAAEFQVAFSGKDYELLLHRLHETIPIPDGDQVSHGQNSFIRVIPGLYGILIKGLLGLI